MSQLFFTKSLTDIPNFSPKVEVVSCFIEYEDCVLMLKENSTDVWGVPGGKIEKGDANPSEAICREVQEETTYKLENPDYLGKWYVKVPGYEYVLHIYRSVLKTRPSIVLSHEHSEAKWIPFKEFYHLNLINEAQGMAFQVVYKK